MRIKFDKIDINLLEQVVNAAFHVVETVSLDKEDVTQGRNQALEFIIQQLKLELEGQ